MIRVNRGDAPEGFADRANAWRTRLAAYCQQKPDITASAVWSKIREDIEPDATILAERFHHKCAYCEVRPGHVSHPHVEHYRPKGLRRFEGQMFVWGNWLLSCGICNQEKWKHFPEENGEPMLLNPAEEEPSVHLCFVGPRLRGITKRGRKTVELVELDRQPLQDERELWLDLVNSLLLLWVESQDEQVRRECREHLIWTLQDDAPFAGMTRTYLGEKCPKLAHPTAPQQRLEQGDRLDRIRGLVEERTAALRRLA
jgi:5-methylcytosine-specific restriction endonuclease McrA